MMHNDFESMVARSDQTKEQEWAWQRTNCNYQESRGVSDSWRRCVVKQSSQETGHCVLYIIVLVILVNPRGC